MATEQRADLAFVAGAKITGLPVSTAAGQPVVHEQLVAAGAQQVYMQSAAPTLTPGVPLFWIQTVGDNISLWGYDGS
jgi:hypothetical protein